MRVSMLEVYNEVLEDLFIPVSENGSSGSLGSPSISRSTSVSARSMPASLDSHILTFEAAQEIINGLSKGAGTGVGASSGFSLLGSSTGVASPTGAGMKPLSLVDHPERGTHCVGLSEVEVKTVDQVTWLLKRAEERCVCVCCVCAWDPCVLMQGLTLHPRLLAELYDMCSNTCQNVCAASACACVCYLTLPHPALATPCRSKFTATALNKASNRAHRVFTVILQFKRSDAWFTTTLTLVDLAGTCALLLSHMCVTLPAALLQCNAAGEPCCTPVPHSSS